MNIPHFLCSFPCQLAFSFFNVIIDITETSLSMPPRVHVTVFPIYLALVLLGHRERLFSTSLVGTYIALQFALISAVCPACSGAVQFTSCQSLTNPMGIKWYLIGILIHVSPVTVEVQDFTFIGHLGVICLWVSNSFPLFFVLLGGLSLTDCRNSLYMLGIVCN